MNYYDSGLPYSEELYHHGVKGQRWGVRRYQNPDGSLTALGKMRYGAQKVREVLGRSAKAVRSSISKAYKKRHPRAMSTEELKEAIERMNLEVSYKQAMERRNPGATRAKKVVGDILEFASKTIVSDMIQLANKSLVNEIDKKFKEDMMDREDKRSIARENRQEARDIARENRQEARDIARENRASAKDRDKLSSRFEKYVNDSMPKDFSKWTSSDWNNFSTYRDIQSAFKDFENGNGSGIGGGNGKSKKRKNKH